MTTRFATRLAMVLATVLALGACAPTSVASPNPTGGETPTPVPTATSTPEPTVGPTADPDLGIVGDWHRVQTCEEMLAAFDAAGLVEGHRDWLQGGFFDEGTAPTTGDPCAGARPPVEHAHFFTSDGEFGSLDEEGNRVDDGDWVSNGSASLAFPSHSTEFGYDGPIVVDFTVEADVATFEVRIPNGCLGACGDAYAWATSAFSSGPWNRGGIP